MWLLNAFRTLRLGVLCVALAAAGCGDASTSPTPPPPASKSPTVSEPSHYATVGTSSQLGPSRQGSQRSMVLVSIDTLRSDHVGTYGGDVEVATPSLDALAAEGVVFERAYSHIPMTLPSHVSMLTGLLPPDHGVRDNIGYRPATADLPYVPRRLQTAGYATGAAVSAYVLQGKGGLARGFDLYEDDMQVGSEAGTSSLGRRGAGGVQRSGTRTLQAVLPWLAEQQDAATPFFLFVHFFEPHTPYQPPPPFAERYGARSYAGEVAAADALVGDLVAELRHLGLYEETAIVVLSDHGEGLGDHGEDEHGLLLYREILQVPLILKLPSAEHAGQRVTQAVGLVDVAPTLLQLAGLPAEAETDGVSLLQTLAGGPRGPLYAETFYPRLHFGWSELTSLIEGDYHYIQGPRAELYDVVQDPAETQDLIAGERRLVARLRDQLSGLASDPQPPGTISARDRQALAALGYIGHVATSDGASGPRPHPKDQLTTVSQIQACLRHYQEGDLVAAEGACRQAIEMHPEALDAWEHLARSLLEQGQPTEALEALERSLALAAGRASHLAVAAASLLLEGRRPTAALALLQREIVLAPHDLSLRLYEARTLVLTGQVETALHKAELLVEEQPEDADAVYLRGAIRIGSGDLEGSEADLRRALELSPAHTAALADLATLMRHRGRSVEAEALYRRLLELRPGDRAALDGLSQLANGAGPS